MKAKNELSSPEILREGFDTPPIYKGVGYTKIGGNNLAEKMFMRVDEVAQSLDVSIPYAYKLIRQLNEDLKKKGCITIAGRIDRKYFYEKFYGSHAEN